MGEVELGRWLGTGVSHKVGRLMSYWILPISGIPVSATTVQRLTNEERQADEMGDRMKEFDSKLAIVFEAQSADVTRTLGNVDPSKVLDPEEEDPEFFTEFTRVIDDATLKHVDDVSDVEVQTDLYVGMELALVRGGDGEALHSKARKRVRDEDGNPDGRANNNPLLDSRKYEIEYIDGYVEALTANLIAQIDEEGPRQMVLGEIMDHRILPDAIPISEGTYENSTPME